MNKIVVIGAGAILTVNIEVENFNVINMACTIGHDVRILSYVTIYPNVSVFGNVLLKIVLKLEQALKLSRA